MDLEELKDNYRTAEIVFLSFPKSGRTWIRYFISKYVEYLTGIEFTLEVNTIPVIPNTLFSHNYFDIHQNNIGTPEIILQEMLNSKKLIFVIRDPRDVAVSYYHQKTLREGGNVGTIDEFVLSPIYGIERQSDFVIKLIEYYKQINNGYLIRYEEIRNNPYEYFKKIIEIIFREVNIDILQRAIDDSTFEKMKEFETKLSLDSNNDFLRIGQKNWKGDPNALKVRKGKINSYMTELKPETIELINSMNRTNHLLQLLKESYLNTF